MAKVRVIKRDNRFIIFLPQSKRDREMGYHPQVEINLRDQTHYTVDALERMAKTTEATMKREEIQAKWQAQKSGE